MDALAALIGQWRGPGRDGGVDLDDLGTSVLDLTAQMTTAIASFLGLTVTTLNGPDSLTLTAVAAAACGPTRTSLRFSVIQRGHESVRITLYAHQPGALVDLDADLTYLSSPERYHPDPSTPTVIDVRLDDDLPAPVLVAGLVGLEGRSALDRAIGVLIEQGSDPEDAASQLRRQAAAAGLGPDLYARQLLAALILRR